MFANDIYDSVMNFVGYKYARSASQVFDMPLESSTSVDEYDDADATPPTSALEQGAFAALNSA